MKRTQYILHLCVVLFLLCLVAATAVFPRLVGAQQTNPPVLRVTGVDVDNYPDVRAYVYGQNLGKEFADVPLFVKQDGVDQVATGSDIVNVGTQVVFLIDSSEDIFKPGKTEIPRYQEVIDAVTRVTRSGVFDPGSDLMTGFAPAPGETIESIIDWTKDHGDVYNHFYQYMPEHGIGQTPLNKLIYYGLDSFSSPQLDERAQRAMVLFSDGVDNLSPEWIDTATSRAQDMNVAIYTVLLGDGTRASRSNLERIAVTTGGQFIQLTSEGALDAMFKHIAQGSQQRSIDYRSTSADPKTVTVLAELDQGNVEASASMPPVDIREPSVRILQPTTGTSIERIGDTYGATLEELLPNTLLAQVQIDFPDGHPRDIRRVEYSLGSDTQVRDSEPFDTIELPISAMGMGNYALNVRAIDEFGLVGDAQPQSIRVTEVTPTPVPTATPTPPPVLPASCPPYCPGVPECKTFDLTCPDGTSGGSQIFAISALVLALLALLLAIIVFLRKPENRALATERITGTIKAMTQPFALDRRARGPAVVKARLHLTEGSANISPVIEIQGTNTRLGRDPSLSNVVLDDPRVSRYHCRITEEADGTFRIYDEGSTSGTYVNYETVDIRGQTLNNGDQIHIGPVGLRFELAQPGDTHDTSTDTEPFAPQYGANPVETEVDDPFKTEPYGSVPPKQE